jgi:hypothetical protein
VSGEDEYPTVLQGEVMLLDWSETAKGGAKIVLQLDSPDALEHFRSLTLAKRGQAGQRLACIIKLLPDDDQAPSPTAGMGHPDDDRAARRGVVAKTAKASAVGPKCQATVRWCASPMFQNWLADAFPAQWRAALGADPQTCAGHVVKALLGIDSRKAIDTDPKVGKEWDELVRIPWMAHQGFTPDDHQAPF